MKNDAGLSAWTDFAEVQAKAQKIHNDSAFLLSVFEGKGTSTYEVFKEVQPTPKYLDPFVDFLADKIKDYAPRLPDRSREMEIITNIYNLSGVSIETNDMTTLSGLNTVTLKPEEYVGIYFNAIKEVAVEFLPTTLTSTLSTEYSMNGKEWSTFIPDHSIAQEMAYFRIKNKSKSTHAIPINEISFRMPASESSVPINVTTNMGT